MGSINTKLITFLGSEAPSCLLGLDYHAWPLQYVQKSKWHMHARMYFQSCPCAVESHKEFWIQRSEENFPWLPPMGKRSDMPLHASSKKKVALQKANRMSPKNKQKAVVLQGLKYLKAPSVVWWKQDMFLFTLWQKES